MWDSSLFNLWKSLELRASNSLTAAVKIAGTNTAHSLSSDIWADKMSGRACDFPIDGMHVAVASCTNQSTWRWRRGGRGLDAVQFPSSRCCHKFPSSRSSPDPPDRSLPEASGSTGAQSIFPSPTRHIRHPGHRPVLSLTWQLLWLHACWMCLHYYPDQ